LQSVEGDKYRQERHHTEAEKQKNINEKNPLVPEI